MFTHLGRETRIEKSSDLLEPAADRLSSLLTTRRLESVPELRKQTAAHRPHLDCCFYMTCKQRVISTFKNGWENTKRRMSLTHGDYMKSRFPHP